MPSADSTRPPTQRRGGAGARLLAWNRFLALAIGGTALAFGLCLILVGFIGLRLAEGTGADVAEAALEPTSGSERAARISALALPAGTERIAVDVFAAYRAEGELVATGRVAPSGEPAWSGEARWSHDRPTATVGEVQRRIGVVETRAPSIGVAVVLAAPAGATVGSARVRIRANPSDTLEGDAFLRIANGVPIALVGAVVLGIGSMLARLAGRPRSA